MSVPGWKQQLWRWVGARLFRCSPHVAHRYRRSVLRFFGADVHDRAKIRRSARIDCPWNLTMRELAIVGDHAMINCTSRVTLGARSVVSQLSIVSTRMRSPSHPGYPIVDEPIVIEDDAWVAADSLVLSGAVVSAGTVIGARGLVDPNQRTEPWKISVGQPTRAIKEREYVARSEGNG